MTDHRIGLTNHQLAQVMEGQLQPTIDALIAHYMERLKSEAEAAGRGILAVQAAALRAKTNAGSRGYAGSGMVCLRMPCYFAEVHLASWKTTYPGIIDQTYIDGLRVEARRGAVGDAADGEDGNYPGS